MSETDTAQGPMWRRWTPSFVAAGLLGLCALMGLSAIWGKSTTFDETAHLTAGYSYWTENDYRLHPENGNLPQRWAALALLGGGWHFPGRDNAGWKVSDVWFVGGSFLYELGNDPDVMMFRGRAMIALLAVALGWLVWRWSHSLFGTAGGLLSVTLYSFCPTVLANGCLVTSDMAAALFFMLSSYCLWQLLNRITWGWLAASCLSVSLLGLAKFSAPVFVPVAVLLVIARMCNPAPLAISLRGTREIHRRWLLPATFGGLAVVHVLVAWIVIWSAYGWRYSMMNDPAPETTTSIPFDHLIPGAGFKNDTIRFMRDHELLPEGYLFGLAHTLQMASQRRAFLNGEFSIHGWRSFFPYCFAVKSPLLLFPLIGVAVAAAIARLLWLVKRGARLGPTILRAVYATSPLWSLYVVYWAFAVTSNLNIGHRHLLPTYPPLYVLLGVAAWWLRPGEAPAPAGHKPKSAAHEESSKPASPARLFASPVMGWIVLSLAGLFALSSATMWPNYLAYFNILAGGPRQGYKHLVDSSLDWGQDLPGLAAWLRDKKPPADRNKPVYLSYFGTGRPSYYGIEAKLLPCFFPQYPQAPIELLQGGLYCISATMLQSVYSQVPGPWNPTYEQVYQQVLHNLQIFESAAQQNKQAELISQQGEEFWQNQIETYQQMRFARLCAALRKRRPLDQVGFSILIYRLTDQEVQQAVFGPAPIEVSSEPHLGR